MLPRRSDLPAEDGPIDGSPRGRDGRDGAERPEMPRRPSPQRSPRHAQQGTRHPVPGPTAGSGAYRPRGGGDRGTVKRVAAAGDDGRVERIEGTCRNVPNVPTVAKSAGAGRRHHHRLLTDSRPPGGNPAARRTTESRTWARARGTGTRGVIVSGSRQPDCIIRGPMPRVVRSPAPVPADHRRRICSRIGANSLNSLNPLNPLSRFAVSVVEPDQAPRRQSSCMDGSRSPSPLLRGQRMNVLART